MQVAEGNDAVAMVVDTFDIPMSDSKPGDGGSRRLETLQLHRSQALSGIDHQSAV